MGLAKALLIIEGMTAKRLDSLTNLSSRDNTATFASSSHSSDDFGGNGIERDAQLSNWTRKASRDEPTPSASKIACDTTWVPALLDLTCTFFWCGLFLGSTGQLLRWPRPLCTGEWRLFERVIHSAPFLQTLRGRYLTWLWRASHLCIRHPYLLALWTTRPSPMRKDQEEKILKQSYFHHCHRRRRPPKGSLGGLFSLPCYHTSLPCYDVFFLYSFVII